MKSTLLVTCMSLALSTLAPASVIVVDSAGGGDFTQIQPAVDAAVDGDTLLVKSGTYLSFVISDKALKIVGDTAALVQIDGAVRVRNLATDKLLLLQNLKATGTLTGSVFSRYGVYLVNNTGHIRIEACEFVGDDSTNQAAFDAIRVEGCSDVAVTRTIATGGAGSGGSSTGFASGSGLHAQDSVVTVYDSSLTGGDGKPGSSGGFGGVGALAISSVLFASGTTFQGGDGGDVSGPVVCLGGSYAGDGGIGILITNTTDAQLLDTIEDGGTGGDAIPSEICSFDGMDGVARYSASGATFTDFSGTARHFVQTSPVRELSTMTLTFTGTPGEQVTLLLARTTDAQFDPSESGVLLVGVPMRLIGMGVVPAGGTLVKQLPVFALGSTPSVTLHMQALFTDPQQVSTLSGPGALVVLNQSF